MFLDLNETSADLANKENRLQLVNSLLVLQNNKDYKKVFDNYLFKDRILELSYKLKFSTQEENTFIIKELESLSELKLLLDNLIKEEQSIKADISATKELVSKYMNNNEEED